MSKSIFKTTAQLSASIGSKLAHRSCPGPHPSEWGIRVFRPRQNPVRQFVGLVRETGFEAPVNPDNPCDRTAAPMALSGGVLVASAIYRQRVLAALESLGLRAASVTVVREAADGAIRLAGLLAQSL